MYGKNKIKSAKLPYLVLYDNISLEFLVPQIKFGEIFLASELQY